MAGISSVLQTALRSLEVATQSLSVASNNIANEQTPGYARQRIVVKAAPSTLFPIRIGSGTQVVKVESVRDQLIEKRVLEEASNKSGEEALQDLLQDVEMLFNDATDTGMLPVVTNFFNSFHALALDPASTQSREQVRVAAENLTNSFSSRAEELQRYQNIADRNIADSINTINSLASRIAAYSGRIVAEEAGGELSNDLRDQRGQLVRELSEYMDVANVGPQEKFQLSVGGALLVFDSSSSTVTADTSLPSGFVALKVGTIDISGRIRSGKIAGWTEARDSLIPTYRATLDQLAYEIEQQVNAIHTTGYSKSGATLIDFFEPLASATDAARQLTTSAAVLSSLDNIAAASQIAGTDNVTALALGNLIHTPSFSGGSVIDQYRSLVFQVANDTTNSQGKVEQHTALLHQLENRRDSVSGVSIDEEAMQILRFQRAYQASASVIRVADELIQTLLALGVR